MFFHELDEGLWFYLRDRRLAPVPGSVPRYNDSADNVGDILALAYSPRLRLEHQKRLLIDWLDQPRRPSNFVLIRGKLYDLLAADLASRTRLVYREQNVKRNDSGAPPAERDPRRHHRRASEALKRRPSDGFL